jgi:hypothetical protein
VTGGAIIGAVAGHRLADPPVGTMRRASRERSPRRVGQGQLHLSAMSAALATAKVPGRHALVSFSF